VISGLHKELGGLLGAPLSVPPPVIRLCSHNPSPVPATGTTPSGAANPPPAAGNVPAVPERATAGPDIGPSLLDLALSCAIAETYREKTVEWAVKQAKTVPGT
jgi:hypothetical protein